MITDMPNLTRRIIVHAQEKTGKPEPNLAMYPTFVRVAGVGQVWSWRAVIEILPPRRHGRWASASGRTPNEALENLAREIGVPRMDLATRGGDHVHENTKDQ